MTPKRFITDMGQSMTLHSSDEAITLPRYGVWEWVESRRKHQVVETSNDLADLQKRYGPCEVYDTSAKKVG